MPDAARQQPVGAAEHGILFVDRGRNAEPDRGKHRRDRRITAEADHRVGRQAPQQPPRLDDPDRGLRDAASGADRSAADPSGPDLANFNPRYVPRKGIGPPVGHEYDMRAGGDKSLGQRLRREQVSPSAAGGKNESC
jgi:hypothetical protein